METTTTAALDPPNGRPETPLDSLRQKRAVHDRRVVATYHASARRDFNPTHQTRYLNIGYWKNGIATLDEASQELAKLVGEQGNFSSQDCILDAGCGFGDAAIFWIRNFRPQRIVAIDINEAEVSTGRQRAAEADLDGVIEFRVASAVEMPFDDNSFTKVVAMEASHHFLTREDFFREAHRVLKHGGRLVATDALPLPGRKARFINPANAYPADVYASKLAKAGFTNVSIRSIRDNVFKPYSNFLLRQLGLFNVRGLMNVALHRFFSAQMDYIVVAADKN
jgi:ubiquinone/menaquinone biosynthesis C-methylase UbiE